MGAASGIRPRRTEAGIRDREALELRRCLVDGRSGIARRYFTAVDRIVHGAWQLGIGSDLALPEVEGKRTAGIRLLNAYMDRLLAAAEHDPVVARQFGRVVGLLDSPASLTRPAILRRVLPPRTKRRTTPTAGAVRHVSPTAGRARHAGSRS